ncbi:MAG: hypothetical protein JXA89_07205 [Anaerolineae bacterium]|nr:hypothetical protein [Anaerolineae bacterium]
MIPSNKATRSAVFWQGYHHEWEYNHRINRLGSYVAQRRNQAGTVTTVAGHSAASGTGNDTAHFQEFVTEVHSTEGVAFQPGYGQTVVECQRGDLTPFVIKIDDLELAPDVQGRDVYAVVLNGFDLCALEHSEKIIRFDVDVTEPMIYAGGTKVRFYIVGHLRFDCRSPECQLLPLRLESERADKEPDQEEEEEEPVDIGEPVLPPVRPRRGLDRHKFDKAATWIKRQLVTLMGVEEVKQSLVGRDADSVRRRLFRFFGRRFYLRFLKWELSAPYRVRVHYMLIGGDRDALAVHDSDFIEHEYSWDLEHEIHRQEIGVLPVTIPGDTVDAYQVNTLAFRQMSMEITIDETLGTEDPVQWGKGMHFLEWSMAIRDIAPIKDGVQAVLDLFYKCWSEAMNEVITLTTWGAVRGAGSARIGARLALLQFKKAQGGKQIAMPGRIYWPGGGLSARSDPRARFECMVDGPAVEA